jgi:hypothetical protein
VLLNISVSEVCIGLSFSATAIYACKWLTVYFCGAEIEDVDSNSGLSSQQSAKEKAHVNKAIHSHTHPQKLRIHVCFKVNESNIYKVEVPVQYMG